MNKVIKRISLLIHIVVVTAFSISFASEKSEDLQEKGGIASLVSDVVGLAGEEPFYLAVKIPVPLNGHVYWKNPGGIGQPLQVQWFLPEGFRLVDELWPRPEVFQEEGLTFYGYSQPVMIIARVAAEKTALSGETYEFKARVEWLQCSGTCLPQIQEVSLTLPVAPSGKRTINQESAAELAKILLALPRGIDETREKVSVFRDGEHLILSIKGLLIQKTAKAFLIPENEGTVVDYDEQQNSIVKGEEGLSWRVKMLADQKDSLLKGVILLTDEQGGVTDSLSFATEVKEAEVAHEKSVVPLLFLIATAFLGGVLLNIMPCVLPLISLKVYGLIRSAGGNRRSVVKHSISFTLGVVSCFLALGGIAFLLQTLGHSVGWGFQFQNPIFLVLLILTIFLFSLSSLGLFEVGTLLVGVGSRSRDSLGKGDSLGLGSFFNGVLATLVTTPCTGPFLGSVLGLVMSLALWKQMAIFTSIGLGMSIPYLILALFPKMLSMLPKPGAWMETFKQVTGFMLMATVVWLLWILGAVSGIVSVNVLLFSLLLLAIGAWIIGRWGTPVSSVKSRRLARCTFLGFFSLALFLGIKACWEEERESTETLSSLEVYSWEPFSKEKIEYYQKQGRGVFVDFTATWCMTCQVNKAIVRAQEAMNFFMKEGIVPMVADWTKKDQQITQELQRLSRASVPVYVYYPPREGALPVILPENISQKAIEGIIGDEGSRSQERKEMELCN